MSTVIICHDSPGVRSILREKIAALPNVTRVTTSASLEDLYARASAERPGMIFVALDKATAAATQLRNLNTTIIAVALPHPRRGDIDAAVSAATAGLRGIVRIDARPDELAAVITEGLAQRPQLAPMRVVTKSPDAPALTKRELEVLAGMSRGRSNAEIGRELFLSEDTIKTHARRLYRKLGASDRAQAVAVGFRFGLLH
jgi:DNA-binding NarL/FixJ family response regulator